MKKWIFGLSFIFILLAGCSIPMNMNSAVKEPNFSGIVEEAYEKSILIRVNKDELTSSELVKEWKIYENYLGNIIC